METNIRIYVANLGKYNEGKLDGDWLDLPVSEEGLEDFYIAIKVAHRDEDGNFIRYYEEDGVIYEEVAIHDYETTIGINIDEFDSIEDLNALAEELENRDIMEIKAIVEATGYTLKEALDVDYFTFYPYQSLEDVARDIVDDCYYLPEFALRYFDYEAFARDLSFDGYTEVTDGVIYIE